MTVWKRALSLLTLTMLLFTGVARASDWVTYLHDAQRTGNQSGETTLNPGNASSLVNLWKFKTGGVIGASASIVNNIVYVGSWDGYEYALDAVSGKQIWKSPFLGITTHVGCYPATAGVDSSAYVDATAGVLYLGGGDNKFYALNTGDGTIKWSTAIFNGPAYDGHYNWASPLIYKGYAYVGITSFGDCPLVQGGLDKIDLSTHAIVAQTMFVPNGQVGAGVWTSPSVDPSNDSIFVTTGTRGDPSQTGAQAMISLRSSDLAITGNWAIPLNEQVIDADWGTTPLFYTDMAGNRRIYAVNKNGNAYAFDAGNVSAGPVWETRLDPGGQSPSDTGAAAYDNNNTIFQGASAVTLNGVKYLGSISAINATTGQIIWRQGDRDQVYQAIAYSNGLVFDGTGSDFHVRNAANGSVLYDFPTSANYVYGAPAISNGRVFVGMTDGYEYAFGLPTSAPTPTPNPLGPGEIDLHAYTNNIGWAADGSNAGNFDTFHDGYASQALATAGLTPGSQLTYGGVNFTWPAATEGNNDNVMAGSQIITLPQPLSGTGIAILGASGSGPWSGNITLNYSDGTSQTDPITLDDWGTNNPIAGNTVVATTTYRIQSGAIDNTMHPVVLMTTIAANANKTLTSMTMPAAGHGQIHIFAMTVLNPGLPATATSTALTSMSPTATPTASSTAPSTPTPSPTPTWTSTVAPTATPTMTVVATPNPSGQIEVNLQPFTNNIGWAVDGSNAGNFDTFHDSYSNQALAAVGITSSAQLAYNGVNFMWPASTEGSNDNVMGVGQTIIPTQPLSGTGIAILGASGSGPWSGYITLNYSDGSSQIDPITLDDWGTSNPIGGNSVVASTAYRIQNSVTDNTMHPVILMATIPATANKTITSMTMPAAGHGQIHIFAMTMLNAGAPAIPTATMTASATPTSTAVIPTATTAASATPTSTAVIPTATTAASATPTSTAVIPTATNTIQPTTTTVPTATSVSSHPGFANLSAGYNNVSTSSDGTNQGNFDTYHSSYSAQALATVGITPGAALAYNGASFMWPSVIPGANDNVMGQGQAQIISGNLSGQTAYFLGAASSGPGLASAVVTYTDATTQTLTLNFSDWTLNGGGAQPLSGNTIVATTPYRLHAGVTDTTAHPVVIEVSAPLTNGKVIKSIIWPTAAHALVHIWAMTVK